MDKENFCCILESALLSFEKVSEEELVNKYNISTTLARAGVRLCEYLRSIDMKEVKNES